VGRGSPIVIQPPASGLPDLIVSVDIDRMTTGVATPDIYRVIEPLGYTYH
jgi:hypothetical protein